MKKRIKNWCLQHLAKSIVDEDILSYSKMTGNQQQALIMEAIGLQSGALWGRLMSEMKNHSRRIMFEKSQNEDDMLFGKACLYMVDIMENKVEKLASIGQPKIK